jgi:hypothetical protein
MKPAVHLHPDGFMRVCNTQKQYLEERHKFRDDWQHDPPPFPGGMTEVIYEPGVRHAYVKDNNVVAGGPMPWPEGDDLIARVEQAAQRAEARKQREEQARFDAFHAQQKAEIDAFVALHKGK